MSRVYVIDDDAGCLTSLSFLLQAYGYECLAFSSASGFFAALPPNATGVVLCDHRLPDGNAISILQRLEETGQTIPLVVLSGRIETEVAKLIRASNAVGLLHKPITAAELTPVIEEALATAG